MELAAGGFWPANQRQGPGLSALMTVKDTAGNVVFAEAIAAVQESIKRGDTVAEPLAASNLFPPALIGMVDVGEQTGALPGMLL